MTTVRSFADLEAWKGAQRLAVTLYRVTKTFPKDELFGLTSQIRRAAVFVAANIAEGFSRRTSVEKKRFYEMSHGSLAEIQSHLLIARDIDLLQTAETRSILESMVPIRMMIYRLMKTAQDQPRDPSPD